MVFPFFHLTMPQLRDIMTPRKVAPIMKTKILTSLAAMREHNEQLQRTLTDTV